MGQPGMLIISPKVAVFQERGLLVASPSRCAELVQRRFCAATFTLHRLFREVIDLQSVDDINSKKKNKKKIT